LNFAKRNKGAAREKCVPPDVSRIVGTALALRETLHDAGSYRLINLHGDGLADAAVDIYGGFAAISWYSKNAMEFKGALCERLLQIARVRGVYDVERFNSSQKAQNYRHIGGEASPDFFEINEGGLRFLCSFSHGQNAGFFIDNRGNREFIAKYSKGRSVLNLFSYTGALSVVAAACGAASVTTVDLSRAYNDWARENLKLNGFAKEAEKVLTFDALDYMRFCLKKGYKFDFIILDPPSFALSLDKKPFSTLKNYNALLLAAYAILSPGGMIAAICNTAGYKRADFKNMIDETFQGLSTSGFKIMDGPKMPPDFNRGPNDRELDYLKNFYVKFTGK